MKRVIGVDPGVIVFSDDTKRERTQVYGAKKRTYIV